MANPEDPNKEQPEPPAPDPGATVAWTPQDIPGLGGKDTPEEGDEVAGDPPAPPKAPPADAGATGAWNPADIPGFPGNDPASETPTAAPAGATMAWDPEDIAHAVGEEVAEPAADDEVDPLVGTMLKGKWRIDKKLGAGAFGTVYRVEDIAGGWMEALKILSVDKLTGAEGESMKKRFLRESQIMKRLGKESKHIVGLSTYEEDFEAGLVYLVMEYVEGQALADLVTESGPLSVERTLGIALQVCDALIAAHAESVVHRDMKLENIMMTTDTSGNEIAKVLDFGIAKIAEKETDSRLTTVGTLGTPGYAAPEQLRAEEVDGRTDLFSMGVILYEMLTKHDPWLGNPANTSTTQIYDLMVLAERGEVRSWESTGTNVPPAMQNVVMKLLKREPDQRYQTAQELRDALIRVREGAEDTQAGSLRILTDTPGVKVEVRSGRSVVADGPTPCVANGISAGTYKVRVVDERYESVETKITLDAGAMEDLTIVTTARASGVTASAKRSPALVAAVLLVVIGGAAAFVLNPWGRTLDVAGLAEKATSVSAAWLTETGIEGQLAVGPLPAPFKVPLTDGDKAAAVAELGRSGVDVDTSWEVSRLVGLAGEAQANMRYFGSPGSDVRSFAERIVSLDPNSDVASSLFLKVAERLAWDAEAAQADGSADEAQTLVQECLDLVPNHPRCLLTGGDD